jgi:hypothetical protein
MTWHTASHLRDGTETASSVLAVAPPHHANTKMITATTSETLLADKISPWPNALKSEARVVPTKNETVMSSGTDTRPVAADDGQIRNFSEMSIHERLQSWQ